MRNAGFARSLKRFLDDECGQDVVEYGLLLATVAFAVLLGVSYFGTNIHSWFQDLTGRITTVGT